MQHESHALRVEIVSLISKGPGIEIGKRISVVGGEFAHPGQRRIGHAVSVRGHLQVVLANAVRERKLLMMRMFHGGRVSSHADARPRIR